jgi:hypothetical protein
MELMDRVELVDLIHANSKTLDAGIENVCAMDNDFHQGYQYWTMTTPDGVRLMVRKLRVGYMAELS